MTTAHVCRKCRDHACVIEFLGRVGVGVDEVRCQKVCKGALVGIPVAGRLEWFKDVSGRKALAGLAAIAVDGRPPSKTLRKRRVRKLSGRPPRT
ncbi:MAG: hypothetical protein AB7H43_03240 [Acidimicrobiia bacterium]